MFFYRKNSVHLHWTVTGKGRRTNFAEATEPVLYSLPSFLKLSTFKTFPHNWPKYLAMENFRLDRGPNPWLARWISFSFGAFTGNLPLCLTRRLWAWCCFQAIWKDSWMKSCRDGFCPNFQKWLHGSFDCLTSQHLYERPENSGLGGRAPGLVRRIIWCVFTVKVTELRSCGRKLFPSKIQKEHWILKGKGSCLCGGFCHIS